MSTKNMVRHNISDEERQAILELQSSDAESSTDEEQEVPIEDRNSTGNSSLCKAVSNILSFVEGIGFLALPYAIKLGGITIIVAFLILPIFSWYTGKLLVECLYDGDEKKKRVRTRSTFKELGEIILPKYGGYVVTCFENWSLFLGCVSYVVLCGSLMSHTIPSIPMTAWICIAGVIVFPTTFLKSMTEIGWLSIISVAALISVVVTVLWYGLGHMNKWDIKSVLFWNSEGISIALPILVLAYASQLILPSVESSMREKHKFNLALTLAYIINAFIKIVFSFLAFLSFGSNTDQVILNNLPEGTIRTCSNLLFVSSCIFSYALCVFPILVFIQTTEIYEHAISKFPKIGSFFIRVIVVVLSLLVAIIFPKFALVVSFAGSLSESMFFFILPCAVHLKLKFKQLKIYQVCLDVFLIATGIACGIFGIIFSGKALVSK
ncbi:vesicular inhibitory amino acid transporter-like [Acropora millepora]|uniref:vesicular inhibitory amino acid transporter-like n=1 Tax=Acropora millepora TaxID=45264 RepID=UPI001CF50C77|nr:vesicular inhibitory amino acid transporter-like [Acropora millepora]XP_044181423.1 vesicular inhibitory amino acid transporter-like [Acropora millepora]XP_044181424.1 vesicular inhibitory amino acid transporter-like [Acropora millepora]